MIRLGLKTESGWWSDTVERHGPVRLLRYVQLLIAILSAPWILKKIGWRGFRDLGWNSIQSRAERCRDFYLWFGIGFLTMLVLFIISIVTGVREWNTFSLSRWVGGLFTTFLVGGIGLGILMETLSRGVLYRTLEKAWTPWVGAWVSSLLIAWVHFMETTRTSFDAGIGAVLSSTLFSVFSNPGGRLTYLNLLMFGLVLCRLVYYRGDIWASIGLHASVVGCSKWLAQQSSFHQDFLHPGWIGGHRLPFNNGWLFTLVLVIFLSGIEWVYRSPSSKRVHF